MFILLHEEQHVQVDCFLKLWTIAANTSSVLVCHHVQEFEGLLQLVNARHGVERSTVDWKLGVASDPSLVISHWTPTPSVSVIGRRKRVQLATYLESDH